MSLNLIICFTLGMQRSILLFEEAIKTEATKKAYHYQLEQFLKWSKIKNFDSLLQADDKSIQILLEDYAMHLKKKVSPNSVPIYFAPIELFFVMNDKMLNYKKIRKLFPGKVQKGNQRGYTREEIQKILDNTRSLRNKAIVLLMASSGLRLGAIPDIKIKHMTKLESSYAIKIYEGDLEEDYVFTTPEASKTIEEYLDQRKKDGEYLDSESPLIRTAYQLGIQKVNPCNLDTLAHIMGRVIKCVDRIKKGNRYDIPKDHGFRKYFATTIKNISGITVTMSEKLINHIGVVQTDGAYFKPTKEIMFESYKLAMGNLTISDVQRLQIENKEIKSRDDKTQSLREELKELKEAREQDNIKNHVIMNDIWEKYKKLTAK